MRRRSRDARSWIGAAVGAALSATVLALGGGSRSARPAGAGGAPPAPARPAEAEGAPLVWPLDEAVDTGRIGSETGTAIAPVRSGGD